MKVSLYHSSDRCRSYVFREPDDDYQHPKMIDPKELVGRKITDYYHDKHGVIVLVLGEKGGKQNGSI